MSLTAEERRTILPLAEGLPPHLVPTFLRSVDTRLNGGPRGQGAAWKAATALLGTYATPAPTSRPGPRWASPRRCRYCRA